MSLCVKALIIILINFLYTYAFAQSVNFADSQKCSVAINHYEQKYKIPKNLLHSIAIIESGRWDAETKQNKPWPWTVNVGGKSHYFENKYQAIEFVKLQLGKGKRNIDVGCNQINLYHHGKNFLNLEQVFNPINNTKYAAEFLKGHFEGTKSWKQAVARYHSLTKARGTMYANKVLAQWRSFAPNVIIQQISDRQLNKTTTSKRKSSSTKRGLSSNISKKRSDNIMVFSKSSDKIPIINHERSSIVEISQRVLSTE